MTLLALNTIWSAAFVVLLAANLFAYKAGCCRGRAQARSEMADNIPLFSIAPDGKSITCHVCAMTSHNVNDVRSKYCGYCHVFHADRAQRMKGTPPLPV